MSVRSLGRGLSRLAAAGSVAGAVPAAAASAYLALFTTGGWLAAARGARRTAPAGRPSTRIAVLIPAHDEEQLIGETVTSLLASDYPAGLLTVHVVADNCTDRTVPIATEAGAVVHEHRAPGGKGAALQWAFGEIDAAGGADAVVIVDADTVVDPGALAAVDSAFAAGAQVVQCFYTVRAPDTSPAVAWRAAALSVRHYLRPLVRRWLGGGCGLFGNGMGFRSEVLREVSWSSHLTEDIELQLELLLRGTRVMFVPDAVVRAEMPATLAAAASQNERWERGRNDLARRYVGRLLRGRGPGRVARWDAAAELTLPPMSLLVVLTAGTTVLGLAGRRGRLVAIGAACTVAQAAHLLSGLVLSGAPRPVYASLSRAPAMVLWKARLWLGTLVRRGGTAWVRTSRNAEVAP